MTKEIDFKRTVYELSRKNPEIVDIMKELGFANIADKGMLNTAGRFMTIPKGAVMKGISMEKIKQVFESKGYIVRRYENE